MNSKNPKISVVIPALNEEKYIGHCLESFKKQTFVNFELIVVDGGSTDNTCRLAQNYGAEVFKITGSNICQARQKGAEEAKGDIIVGADADTTYPPSHLDRIEADYNQNKQIVAVGGGGIFERKPFWTYWGWKIAYFIIGKIFKAFGFVVYIPAFNFSFQKDIFKKIGGYRTYLDFGGDELDILERLKKAGRVYFDQNLTTYPSSRRAKLGFWQLLIKHTLIDYYLNYFLAKVFRRTIIKGKPVR